MERNILLTIEYDGTNFSGWQRQPGIRTVQGTLENILSKVCGEQILLEGTSRTDAGVHALGQRASFKCGQGIPVEKIPFAVNNIAGDTMRDGDVKIVCAEEVAENFHARFDSKGKKYIYRIRNSVEMSVFLRNYRYRIWRELNINLMRKAASYIAGTHDFACFQAAGGTVRQSTVRTVHNLKITENFSDSTEKSYLRGGTDFDARDIDIEITGDGFLYNMVRIIAGTLVEVGLGKIDPDEVKNIIESGNRSLAGHTAPPQGLFLVEIYY